MNRIAIAVTLAALWLANAPLRAEPYLAVREGLRCGQCHVDPAGGGLRTVFGNTYAQTQFAARRENPDALWTGMVGTMLQLGGNLRGSARYTHEPREDNTWGQNFMPPLLMLATKKATWAAVDLTTGRAAATGHRAKARRS